MFKDKFTKAFKAILPSPLSIALLLTVFTFTLAIFFGNKEANSLVEIATYWEKGLWGMDLVEGIWRRSWQLPFLVQMMLMLVLGYVLAMSKPFNWLVNKLTRHCTNTAKAAAIISFLTILVSLFNWGLGLVFGAIFARKVAEFASRQQFKLHYGLIGAAGYSGMMTWHGGLSGSAPIKAAEAGALDQLVPNSTLGLSEITLDQTVFSSMNLTVSFLLLTILPISLYFIGRKTGGSLLNIKPNHTVPPNKSNIIGAEKIDHSPIFLKIMGGLILLYAIYKAFILPERISLTFLTPDFINLALLALAFTFHQNIFSFLKSLDHAISSASGILIQFPFYFGILGIMKYSGLMADLSSFFVEISNDSTFSINTLLSASVVNIFVPSGGGQWAVQGPIILEAANQLNLSLSKSIMAIAYGDQLTNMLQPFWALPLLGITGLKPKEIIPFTLILMVIGFIIFTFGLLLF
ncbi:MAG: short-chain fatty acid transporter [Crocinitomicaceae bacterium]